MVRQRVAVRIIVGSENDIEGGLAVFEAVNLIQRPVIRLGFQALGVHVFHHHLEIGNAVQFGVDPLEQTVRPLSLVIGMENQNFFGVLVAPCRVNAYPTYCQDGQ